MKINNIKINSDRWFDLENFENEIWKDIEDYKGIYQISNLGRVKSLQRKINANIKYNKKVTQKEKIKAISFDKDGYCLVSLWKNNKGQLKRVHQLVAKAFIKNPSNKPIPNHLNGIKSDNRVENLEWCTRSENDLHAYRIGLRKVNKTGTGKFGKLNGASKPIYMIDKNTNQILYKFDALADAARFLGRKANCMSGISRQVKGKTKTAYGYKWRYVNEN